MVNELRSAYIKTCSDMEHQLGNIMVWSRHFARENITNSDALYHDLDHTVMCARAGQAILEGRHLSEGGVTLRNWVHVMIAFLGHDIGHVKSGVQSGQRWFFAAGIGDGVADISPTLTNAALAPCKTTGASSLCETTSATNCFRL